MLEAHRIHPSLHRPVLYAGVAPAFLFVEACAVFLLLFEAGVHTATVLLSLFYCAVLPRGPRALGARAPKTAGLSGGTPAAPDFYWGARGLGAPTPPIA